MRTSMSVLGRVPTAAVLVGAVVLAIPESAASTITIATFSDPAADGTTPLFELDGTTFSGGWSAPGLTLTTPQAPVDEYPNVTFNMDNLTLQDAVTLSEGKVEFFDQYNQLLLTITFDAASLYYPFGFGASDLLFQNVVFSGDIVPIPVSEESFAFSFANQIVTPGGFTATAAFTSSAVPEPTSLVLLVLGAATMLAVRRRRR